MNNISFYNKIIFSWKKPKIIIVIDQRKTAAKEISKVLRKYFKTKEIKEFSGKMPAFLDIIRNEVFVCQIDPASLTEAKPLIEKSGLAVLAVVDIGDISMQERIFEIQELVKLLNPQSYLILNNDDEYIRKIKNDRANLLTFGFQKEADFRATDVLSDNSLNFKLNFRKNIVPLWLEKETDQSLEKEQIYSALSACATGTVLGINLVEISQAIRIHKN